jgi:hypothetical protein
MVLEAGWISFARAVEVLGCRVTELSGWLLEGRLAFRVEAVGRGLVRCDGVSLREAEVGEFARERGVTTLGDVAAADRQVDLAAVKWGLHPSKRGPGVRGRGRAPGERGPESDVVRARRTGEPLLVAARGARLVEVFSAAVHVVRGREGEQVGVDRFSGRPVWSRALCGASPKWDSRWFWTGEGVDCGACVRVAVRTPIAPVEPVDDPGQLG